MQLNRRDLLQTFLMGSIAEAALQPATAHSSEKHLEVARCTTRRVQTPYGVFDADNIALNLQDFTFAGGITNNTDRSWRWVSFLVTMRGYDGQPIRHDDRFDGYLYLRGIRKGETQPVISADGKAPRLLLQPSQPPASIEITFVPERSHFDSRYVFSLVHPTTNSDLDYRDDVLNINFTVTSTELRFKLRNQLAVPVTIDWEKTVHIDLNGTKHRVIHQGVRLTDKDKKQAPTRLDAGATLDEMVYPADLVAGSRVFEDWRLNPLLPLSQYAAAYRWRTFGLLLPVTTAGKTNEYLFTMRIENVLSV